MRDLRDFIRTVLLESQLEDIREAKRAWASFIRILRDPKNVVAALHAGGDLGTKRYPALRIEGSDVHPALAGYFIRSSPYENDIFSDRFLDMDPDGERVYPDKELQVPLTMPPKLAVDWQHAKTPEGIAEIVSGWANDLDTSTPAGKMQMLFFHEFLHALQATRSGPEATQRAFKGPDHPTSQRRLAARLKKKQKPEMLPPYRSGEEFPPDIVRSAQGSESYADMDYILEPAAALLNGQPNIPFAEFMRASMIGRSAPGDKRRRVARMLSKMWHEHQE